MPAPAITDRDAALRVQATGPRMIEAFKQLGEASSAPATPAAPPLRSTGVQIPR